MKQFYGKDKRTTRFVPVRNFNDHVATEEDMDVLV